MRPPVHVDKGQAVRELVEQAQVRMALFAGDDTTDLDALMHSTGWSPRVLEARRA